MRHVDEVAGTGFSGELQPFAPAHAGAAFDDVNNAFQMTVMMRAGLSVGVDGNRSRPELLGTDSGEVDRGFAIHAGRLGSIAVKLVARDNAYAVMLPLFVGWVVIVAVCVGGVDSHMKSVKIFPILRLCRKAYIKQRPH